MEKQTQAPARRRRVQAIDREATRALLVDAAIRVFAAKGFLRSTVDQITEEAGTSRATFYLHFRTKTDLLQELLERATGFFEEPYERLALSLRAGDRDAVRQWVMDTMQQWVDVQDLVRPVYEAADADPETYRRVFPDDLPGLSVMAKALREADVILDVDNAEVYTIVLYSPLLHLFRKHLRGEPFDHALTASVLAAAWVDIVAGRWGRR